jgi:hypothetical protein
MQAILLQEKLHLLHILKKLLSKEALQALLSLGEISEASSDDKQRRTPGGRKYLNMEEYLSWRKNNNVSDNTKVTRIM